MAHIDLRLLGPFEIHVDGQPPPRALLWRKNTALLVYLALSPGCSRNREHLIGLLWAERSQEAARQSLREALRVLRRSLGNDTVVTAGEDVIRIVSGN